jgi:hypothetical protein
MTYARNFLWFFEWFGNHTYYYANNMKSFDYIGVRTFLFPHWWLD